MSLVSDQERRNLGAVAVSRAAAMLSSVSYSDRPTQDSEMELPVIQLDAKPILPATKNNRKRIDISREDAVVPGSQLRTQRIAKIGDNGQPRSQSYTQTTDEYLSYTLQKDGVGKV